ncbi:MAG TPA: helix-turn-helix domain-containing protein, partial [Opitutaceae bacterium]|nr:helix-turn-helix domain-containing protein [Opitutaceae bacterium]
HWGVNVLKVNHRQSIQALYVRGWSRRCIARELGMHRKTVARHVGVAKSPEKPLASAKRQCPSDRMPTLTRPKPQRSGKPPRKGDARPKAAKAKPFRFAPDLAGIIVGPGNLSVKEGFEGR